jgi:hypothetical protein
MTKLYDVKVVTWVTVNATDQHQAKEIVADRLYNGEYSVQFEQDSEIEDAVPSEDQSQI